jgi:hypothetical protein
MTAVAGNVLRELARFGSQSGTQVGTFPRVPIVFSGCAHFPGASMLYCILFIRDFIAAGI